MALIQRAQTCKTRPSKHWQEVSEREKLVDCRAEPAFTTVPHHESFFPNYNKGEQRFADFRTLLYGDAGKSH